MKLSFILNMFMFLMSISVLGTTEDFYEKYNQPKYAQGSPEDFKKFRETGKCINGNLRDFDLTEPIEKLNKEGKQIALYNTDCRDANFSYTNMPNAVLSYGNFTGANFQSANLEGVSAWNALFRNAGMNNVIIRNAKLYFADFTGAGLVDANLNGAKVNIRTCFRDVFFKSADLRNIDDLDKVDFCGAILINCKTGSIFWRAFVSLFKK